MQLLRSASEEVQLLAALGEILVDCHSIGRHYGDTQSKCSAIGVFAAIIEGN